MTHPRIRPHTAEREARAILASDSPPSLAAFARLALDLPGACQPFAHPPAVTNTPPLPSEPIRDITAFRTPDGGGGPWAQRQPDRPRTVPGPRLRPGWWIVALVILSPGAAALLWLAGLGLWSLLRVLTGLLP